MSSALALALRSAAHTSQQLRGVPSASFADLPLEVFRGNIWACLLTDQPACARLRLTCRSYRDLVDQLITTASACMGGCEQDPCHTAVLLWRLTAEPRCSYLARLANLEHLDLRCWASETQDLVPWLVSLGAARNGHLPRLSLSRGLVTVASAWAVQVALPRLQALQLGHVASVSATKTHLEGAFFLGLAQHSSLTTLTLHGGCILSHTATASLQHLTRLQSLTLNCAPIPDQLCTLSRLVRLQHFHLANCITYSLGHAAPMFTLTALTHLHIHAVRHPAGDRNSNGSTSSHPPAATATMGVRCGSCADAIASLRRLTRLQYLCLGRDTFIVTDPVFAALCQLTRLTLLEVASVTLALPPAHPGPRLPLLRHLLVSGHNSPHRSPSNLLQTLQPLLPLSHLENLTTPDVDAMVVQGMAAQHGGGAAAQAAALRQAAQHLAAAPHLQGVSLTFTGTWRIGLPPLHHLTLRHITEGLLPRAQEGGWRT